MLGADEISAMGIRLTGRTHFAQGYWSISFRFCQIICHMTCKKTLFFVSVLANLMYVCVCARVCMCVTGINDAHFCPLLIWVSPSLSWTKQQWLLYRSSILSCSRLGSLSCFFLHNFLGTFKAEKRRKNSCAES
jgi:hypothetical protein